MKLPITAWILFLISFFLPAYADLSGYTCAVACLFYYSECVESARPWTLYFFPFTFSNILMFVLPILVVSVCRRRRLPFGILIIQLILFVHVVSWPILMSLGCLEGSIKGIGIGYYIWFVSMVLMLRCTFLKTGRSKRIS